MIMILSIAANVDVTIGIGTIETMIVIMIVIMIVVVAAMSVAVGAVIHGVVNVATVAVNVALGNVQNKTPSFIAGCFVLSTCSLCCIFHDILQQDFSSEY